MNCEELREQGIALLLDELDDAVRRSAELHSSRCEACASWLEDLRQVRARLGEFQVPSFRPTNAAMVRELASMRTARAAISASPTGSTSGERRVARWVLAAASVLIFFGVLAVLRLHAETERGRLQVDQCRASVQNLARYVQFLEQRHDADLLTLARAVDDGQRSTAGRWETQLATLRDATRQEMLRTRAVVGDMANLLTTVSWQVPQSGEVPKDERQ